MPYINHPLALANVLTSLVVPAGGVDKYYENWLLEKFTNLLYLWLYHQDVDTPSETH